MCMLPPGSAAPKRRARASGHDVADGGLAHSGDKELRHAVPGEVHSQGTQVGARGIAQYRVAGMPGERVDEAQARAFGDAAQVDLVGAAAEVEDLVSRPWLGIGTGTEHKGVITGAAPKLVRPATAVDEVVAGPALDQVGGIVADDQIVARAAEGVFHGDAFGDGYVAHQAANVGERGLIEVDLLVLGETG